LEAVFVLLESLCPSRRIFIGSHSLPPLWFAVSVLQKCPWHLEGNHTTEQYYQLRRALKVSPDPRPPHDKKGKKKADEGNGDFQEPDKTVNVLFGGPDGL
jgi:hypothetical protein